MPEGCDAQFDGGLAERDALDSSDQNVVPLGWEFRIAPSVLPQTFKIALSVRFCFFACPG